MSQVSSAGRETWTWDGSDVLNWSGPSNPAGGGITTSTNLMVQGMGLVRSVGADADGSPLNRQYHLDNQGSVQALTGSSASVEEEYALDAWGNQLTTSTSDNRSVYLGGLGYWQEAGLGLNYVRARWMDPLTGQWLSVDSVPTEPRYLYVGNSPTMRVDPSGTQGVGVGTVPHNLLQRSPNNPIDLIDLGVITLLPELKQFALDPVGACNHLLDHFSEFLWSTAVDKVADLAISLGINHVPDPLARFYGPNLSMTRSQWDYLRNHFPSIAPFLPPYPLSSRWIYWTGGFMWGLGSALKEMAPPITLLNPAATVMHGLQKVPDFINACLEIFAALRAKGFSKLIKDAIKATRNRFFNFFENAVHKSAFEQGKLTGTIVANVVATILSILAGIGLIKNIAALVDFVRTSGLAGEVLEALATEGRQGAEAALRSRIKRGPNGTILFDGSVRKAPVDLGSGPLHTLPSDGTAMVPRGQGTLKPAGGDVVAKSGEQINTVTRRLLAGAEPTAERSGRFFSTARIGVVLSDDLLNGMKDKLAATPRKELNGLKLFIQGDNDKMDRGAKPDVGGYYIPKIKGKRAPRIWLKKTATRLDAFEELYHYILDERHGFPGQYDELPHYEDEKAVSIALLYLKLSGGKSAPGLGALCKAVGLGPVFDDVVANGWTGKELISIDRYLQKHEGDISDYHRRNSARAAQVDKESAKLRNPKP